jgi:putative resolvase
MQRRDGLAWLGVEHLCAALAGQLRRIVVVEDTESTDDVVGDMIEVLTSMCAGLYGCGCARNRALCVVSAAKLAHPTAKAG